MFLIALGLSACKTQKETIKPRQTSNTALVESAKQWFDNQYDQMPPSNSQACGTSPPSEAVEYEHFLQEMILAYYKHPENSYDAGETTLSIDVSDLENHPKVKFIYEKLVQSGSLQTFLRQFDNKTGFMNLEIKVTPFSNNTST